jgi:hypothetical protein
MPDPMNGMWEALHNAGCEPLGEVHVFDAYCPGHGGRSHRNLHVAEGSDGRVLLTCHAGCDWRAIVNALGMDGRALFPVGHKSGHRATPTASKPRPLSAGAAFIDSLTLAGYAWNAAVMLAECPYCAAGHCVLRVWDGGADGRFAVAVDCSDGCGADEVRRAVETRAAIAEKGLVL